MLCNFLFCRICVCQDCQICVELLGQIFIWQVTRGQFLKKFPKISGVLAIKTQMSTLLFLCTSVLIWFFFFVKNVTHINSWRFGEFPSIFPFPITFNFGLPSYWLSSRVTSWRHSRGTPISPASTSWRFFLFLGNMFPMFPWLLWAFILTSLLRFVVFWGNTGTFGGTFLGSRWGWLEGRLFLKFGFGTWKRPKSE